MADFTTDAQLRDPSKQKRRNARISVRLEAEFRMAGESVTHPADLVDLGTGGIGLTARMPLYPGDRLILSFRLEDRYIQVAVVVSRASGKNFGVLFEDPEDPAISHIQDYIQKKFFAR